MIRNHPKGRKNYCGDGKARGDYLLKPRFREKRGGANRQFSEKDPRPETRNLKKPVLMPKGKTPDALRGASNRKKRDAAGPGGRIRNAFGELVKRVKEYLVIVERKTQPDGERREF